MRGNYFSSHMGQQITSILRAPISGKAPERALHFLLSPQEGAFPGGHFIAGSSATLCLAHWATVEALLSYLIHHRDVKGHKTVVLPLETAV